MITQTEESFYQKQDNEILKEPSLVGKQARRFQIFYIPCTSLTCLLKPTLSPAMLGTREAALQGSVPSCYSTMDFQGSPPLPPLDTLTHTWQQLHSVSLPTQGYYTSLNRPWNKNSTEMELTISQLSHGRRKSPISSTGERADEKSRDFCWTTVLSSQSWRTPSSLMFWKKTLF